MKSTSQTLMSLASYNFEQVNKQYCAKNGKLKNEFIKWAKCGNKAKVNTEKCWDKMIVAMSITHKVKNSKSRIPLICWLVVIYCFEKICPCLFNCSICSVLTTNGSNVRERHWKTWEAPPVLRMLSKAIPRT